METVNQTYNGTPAHCNFTVLSV